jgi:four helix bundle protein
MSGTIRRFEDIEAWKTGRELAAVVYQLSRSPAFERDFPLRDQIRRAAISVVSNIAEGFESRTNTLFLEFLGRAKGSAGEVRAQAYVALDAGLINEEQFGRLTALAEKCSKQIGSLMACLHQSRESRPSGNPRCPTIRNPRKPVLVLHRISPSPCLTTCNL